MKILLKILVAPFALALSLLAALLVFLFDICAVLLTIWIKRKLYFDRKLNPDYPVKISKDY